MRKSLKNIYDFISDHLYFYRPDLEINGEKYNSTLLFSLLTTVVQGKQLIVGEPGLGKTTSAEYICSVFYQIPLGTIWLSEVAGHPEQTEEKIVGRPNLGLLNKGIESVVWSNFVQLPVKIVDEINRLPETKQSIILDGVDRGNWQYLNEMFTNDEYCLFATANYQDLGTFTIIPPMLDRFDVMVESKHPGANISYLIASFYKKDELLRHEKYERELNKLLNDSKLSYEIKIERIEKVYAKFSRHLEKMGLQPISKQKRKAIQNEIEDMELDLDANAFLRTLISELSFCYKYGQKRANEKCEEGCHFTGYLCHSIKNCISNRFPISVKLYAKALAWFLGNKQVNVEHIKTVAPYALSHRLQWKEEFIAIYEKETRVDPLPIYLAKVAVDKVLERYGEQRESIKEALAVAYDISQGKQIAPLEGDHPIYWEIKRDLGEL